MVAQRYWFKANKSGYGWHPHTWQGWLVFFLYIAALIYSFLQVQTTSSSETFWAFLPKFILFTAILNVITYLKGESITWGSKGRDQHEIP